MTPLAERRARRAQAAADDARLARARRTAELAVRAYSIRPGTPLAEDVIDAATIAAFRSRHPRTAAKNAIVDELRRKSADKRPDRREQSLDQILETVRQDEWLEELFGDRHLAEDAYPSLEETLEELLDELENLLGSSSHPNTNRARIRSRLERVAAGQTLTAIAAEDGVSVAAVSHQLRDGGRRLRRKAA